MMILFVTLTKGIGHKFCQLMKSSLILVSQSIFIFAVCIIRLAAQSLKHDILDGIEKDN